MSSIRLVMMRKSVQVADRAAVKGGIFRISPAATPVVEQWAICEVYRVVTKGTDRGKSNAWTTKIIPKTPIRNLGALVKRLEARLHALNRYPM